MQRVKIIGPVGCTKTIKGKKFNFESSSQLGKTGVIRSEEKDNVVVLLDGEDRPRNFNPKDVSKES